MAAWLAQTTRLHVFLLGRSGRSAKRNASHAWIPPLNTLACVTAVQCDVGRADDIAGLLVRVAAAGPLRILVHAGGALQDGTVGKQDMKSVRTAFAGKLQVRPVPVPKQASSRQDRCDRLHTPKSAASSAWRACTPC